MKDVIKAFLTKYPNATGTTAGRNFKLNVTEAYVPAEAVKAARSVSKREDTFYTDFLIEIS